MNLYIDTCVLPRDDLSAAGLYRNCFGPDLGFELLPMFDIPEWENTLRASLALFSEGPLFFHEPVWGVEHSAPRGSDAWEQGMYHLRLTARYAALLHPSAMVCHLNNCVVPDGQKDQMLRTSLENIDDLRRLFPGVRLLIENTGIRAEKTQLLNQAEYTDLAREMRWDVLIDIGHANANAWDLPRLIHDLKDQIRGFHLHNNDGIHDLHQRINNGTLCFPEIFRHIMTVPDAALIIEYTRPSMHGEPLLEDCKTLIDLMNRTNHSSVEAGNVSEPVA